MARLMAATAGRVRAGRSCASCWRSRASPMRSAAPCCGRRSRRESRHPFATCWRRRPAFRSRVENDCNMIALALRWHDPERYRRRFHRHPAVARHRHGHGAAGRTVHRHTILGRRVRPHDPSSRRRALPLRPARLRRSLCRQLRDLAHAPGPAEDACRSPMIGDADIAALADRARARDGPERDAFRKAGEALGFGLGSLFALIDPAPVAMVGAGRRAFDLIGPACARRSPDRRRPAQQGDLVRHRAQRNAADPRRCAVRALTAIDEEIVAPGPGAGAHDRQASRERSPDGRRRAAAPQPGTSTCSDCDGSPPWSGDRAAATRRR